MRSIGGITSIWCFQASRVQNTCERGICSDTCNSCLSGMKMLSNNATRGKTTPSKRKKIHSQEKYKKYNFLYKVDFLFSLHLRELL